MKFPSRRKPLALFFCYGFVGVIVGGYAADAQESASVPLRVDPVLLGQPPLKATAAPAPEQDSPRSELAPEIRPVESAVVEARPVNDAAAAGDSSPAETPSPVRAPAKTRNKASAQQIPSRAVAPPPLSTQAEPLPAPTPSDTELPVSAPPVQSARTAERQKTAPVTVTPVPTAEPPARGDQASPATVERSATGVKAEVQSPAASVVDEASPLPLSVDPAQLGVSTVSAGASPAPAPGVGELTPATQATPTSAVGSSQAPAEPSWFARAWDPVAHAYETGDWEFYLPAITYHSRSTYTQEQIDSYQERPLGFGVGKGSYDAKGNWQGVYAMAFQDSHYKPSYIAGYGWKAVWRPGDDVRVGLGYTAGLMARSDVGSYVPFPIVLPLASISYKNFSLEGAYVPPGGEGGNVFFIWGKWELGKTGQAVGTPSRPAPVDDNLATVKTAQAVATAEPAVASATSASLAPATGGSTPVSGSGRQTSESAQVAGVPPAVAPSPSLPATSAGADAGDEASPALVLRASPAMLPQPKESAVPRPIFLSAQRMDGTVDREFVATGEAELRKIGTVVNADRLTYWPIDDEMEAEGHVRLELDSDVITGPKMRLRLEDQIGFFEQPSYAIRRQPPESLSATGKSVAAGQIVASADGDSWFDSAWLNSGFASPSPVSSEDTTSMPKVGSEGRGDAERIDFEGENHYRMTRGSYTTCAPGNDDWYLKTGDLRLDYDREVADGSDGTLYFKETPIFYSPWISFSLNNERKSGFLAPSYGTSSNNGVSFALPYYWNIAPNMDATITPTVLSKRGLALGGEVRYLSDAFGGTSNSTLRASVLPDDHLDGGDTRYEVSLQHAQTLANGWSGTINYTKVSDDTYYTDLSSSLTSTSQVNLLQQATLTYGGGGWWSATANFQGYQTLQPDAKNLNTVPYQMLPQLTVNARKPDLYFTDATFMGQYTNFTIKERVQNGTIYPDGQRTVLYPQLALPYVTPGWYVTPKIGVNYSNYSLSGQAAGVPGSIDRTLPIFSVDSGMTFERSSNWFGRDYTQTLEPRLYYLNIPYRDQSQIPIFDTGLADFNFAQIFSENQFSGWDRVSNANQLTVAATSRLIEPDSGNEIVRAMLGQRFYFEQNKVLLPGATTDTGKWEKSAFLGAFSGQILPKVYVDTAVQYDGADRQVDQFSIGSRYQPDPGKVLNVSYRYNRSTTTPIDQVDVSGQWPISGGLYGVGRINYAFKDDSSNTDTTTSSGRVIEAIGGLEYNGGCWVLRGVVQHIATTQDSTSTGFFIQLELSNFSRIGSNPLDVLRRNIQGYSLINQPTGTTLSGQ